MISIIISSFNQNKHVKSVLIGDRSLKCIQLTNGKEGSSTLNGQINLNLKNKSLNSKSILRVVYKYEIDHYILFLFLNTLNQSNELRHIFVQQFSELKFTKLKIKYKLSDTPKYPLLKSWNSRIIRLYHFKMNLEVGFSWLSTLGGACATLGDKYKNFAQKAALISNDQLKLSLMLSDPYTIVRCLIYNAYSLIQRDQLDYAFNLLKRIVYPTIKKYYSFKTESEEYFIVKGMYKSAKDHFHFKKNHLKKLCGKNKMNGLRILTSLPIIVS